jgi:uncharacterized protein YaiI (UPF0178 family)
LLEIYVDADACPVKDEVMRLGERHGLAIHMVGNSWMRLDGAASVNRVVVPEGLDAADNWIAEHVGAGDIAITADIRLAARCLARGCRVLGPTGKAFTDAGIGMALAMRDLNEYLRDAGEIRGGGPAFSRKDRSRFLEALEQMVQSLKREDPKNAGR